MYIKNDVENASKMILDYIDDKVNIWYDKVYQKYDKSWYRMLQVMRGEKYENLYCS